MYHIILGKVEKLFVFKNAIYTLGKKRSKLWIFTQIMTQNIFYVSKMFKIESSF